jgi:hypothetical protein
MQRGNAARALRSELSRAERNWQDVANRALEAGGAPLLSDGRPSQDSTGNSSKSWLSKYIQIETSQ